MSACGAILITLPALIALIVLFFWTAASSIFGNDANENNDGDGRPWWDLDFSPEEVESAKVLLNLLFLIIACGTLFVPINMASSGVYERFNVGVLASSLFMFGNMLFVSFWYMMNFGRREEENNNNGYNGYNGYNPYWTMDEQELLAYHQKVVSYVTLAFALAFFGVSAIIYSTGEMLPQTLHGSSIRQTQAHVTASAQFEAMSGMWTFLSLCNIVIFVALFFAACLLLGGEEAERMVEEARIINLITVLLCLGIVSIFMLLWGNTLFSEKRWGSLGVGMLYGGTKYFAALLFMVCLLFANLTFDERQGEEGVWVASATSFACFFLSLLHLAFSMRARRYQLSIYDANSEQEVTVLDARTGMVHSAAGDFVRVDDMGMQVT